VFAMKARRAGGRGSLGKNLGVPIFQRAALYSQGD
jgi:hypothetical protein